MNEEKQKQLAEYLTKLCFREAQAEETCPVGIFDNCPFPDIPCMNVTPEDWKAWMGADK